MKRILIMDTGSFRVFGGAAKTAYDTYKYFREMGYKVDLFGDFSPIDRKIKTVKEEELRPDIYDVVLLNSVRDIPVVERKLLGNQGRTRFIYTDRGNLLNNFKNAGIKRLLPKMVVRHYLMHRMKRWLGYYVALTAEQEELARGFFARSTKVVFIPNWYSRAFRVERDLRKKKCAIYVGRLDERQKKVSFLIKGIYEFIRENQSLKDCIILRIVGGGPDEKRYIELSDSMGLSKNIEFIKFAPEEDLIRLYNEALFFVSTSEWEGMAGTFVEAMACGLPLLINQYNNTVLSKRPLKSLVEDGYNGLIYEYGDLRSFCSEFGRLYLDPEFRKRLAKNSLEFSSEFALEKSMKRYRDIVDRV
jgi:glycosyltransferase involved in cell wall biosynthesis